MDDDDALPRRLRRYPVVALPGLERRVRLAASFRARLLGLAGLRCVPPDAGLLLLRTRSVHTFGMRFALDLVWIDRAGEVVRVDESVPPQRVRRCRRAWGVVERPARRSGEQLGEATSQRRERPDGSGV